MVFAITAGTTVQSYASHGARVEISNKSTIKTSGMKQFPMHPSAKSADDARARRTETLEKVAQGHSKFIPWTEPRQQVLTQWANIKISPIVAYHTKAETIIGS